MSRLTRLPATLLVCAVIHGATLRYSIAPCNRRETGCHPGDPELAEWALQAWEAASAGALRLTQAENPSRAHIRLLWASGRDGLYGETRPIIVDGVRGAEIYVLPTVVPPTEKDELLRDAIVYLTCLHESGHALGLEHTADFADIMYSFQYGGDIAAYFGRYRRLLSSRPDIRKHSGMSDGDRRQLAAILAASAAPPSRH
jgi:hypothetical protein